MGLDLTFAAILLGGWLFARLFNRMALPPVLGMTIWGVLWAVFFPNYIPDVLWDLAPTLKSFALIVILLRAGLGIKLDALRRIGKTAFLLALLPCSLEALALTPLLHYLLDFSWLSAALTGALISAVSPAVVVPSMLRMKDEGYGKKKEIPTLILAGASLDDVFAITAFSLLLQFHLGSSSAAGADLGASLGFVPVSILGGVVPGIITGFLLAWFFKKNYGNIRATEKALILLVVSILMVKMGEVWNLAVLLGVMTQGFLILERSPRVADELSSKMNKIWVFAEIVLFVLIGMSVEVEAAKAAGWTGLLILSMGLVIRSFGVIFATHFSGLSWKERVFCVIAYLPKATVQAALGAVPLSMGVAEGPMILALAVMAIIFTAPLGLIGIRTFGPRLLERGE